MATCGLVFEAQADDIVDEVRQRIISRIVGAAHKKHADAKSAQRAQMTRELPSAVFVLGALEPE